MSAERQKGTAFETKVVRYIRQRFPEARRIGGVHGAQDRGDIGGIFDRATKTDRVIECKWRKTVAGWDLPGWWATALTKSASPTLIVSVPRRDVARSVVVDRAVAHEDFDPLQWRVRSAHGGAQRALDALDAARKDCAMHPVAPPWPAVEIVGTDMVATDLETWLAVLL